MKPQTDPTKTDVSGMASDDQIRSLLASDTTPDRLRTHLEREAARRQTTIQRHSQKKEVTR